MARVRGNGATKIAATSSVDNIEEIKDTHTSELVIALCGPIGSPIHDVAKAFKTCLEKSFGYDYAQVLKLSRQIEKLGGQAPSGNEYRRVKYLIDKGDELRKKYGPGVLAELAVSEIALDRQKTRKKVVPKHLSRDGSATSSIRSKTSKNSICSAWSIETWFIWWACMRLRHAEPSH